VTVDTTPAQDVYQVNGHQIRGYALLERRVSRATEYTGRVVLPWEWAGKRVKIVVAGEVIEGVPRAAGKQARLNVHGSHVGEVVSVVRVEP